MAARITLLTVGSLGDMLPFIALAKGLGAAGYGVRLALPVEFEGLARDHGVETAALRCDIAGLIRRHSATTSDGFLARARFLADVQRTVGAGAMADALAASEDAEALIFHPLMSVATDIAEARGQAAIMAALQPLTATAGLPLFSLTSRSLGPALNRMSYAGCRLLRVPVAGRLGRFRNRLGLARRPHLSDPFAVAGQPVPVIYGFSPALLPKPDDWPASAHVCGFWHTSQPGEAAWRPDTALAAFLGRGEAPVYVGFGSNPADLSGPLRQLLYPALARAGLRAIVLRGGAGPAPDDGEHIHYIGTTPHGGLFRHVRAAIHQAGAGTTAAVLRAGLASLTVPAYTDQDLWAERLASLGAGPAPLPVRRWTAARLDQRLDALVNTPGFRQSAARLGGVIGAEDGIARAVEVVRGVIG